MNEINEAVVVLCKCGKAHKTYGIRAEKAGLNHWRFTWAFPIKESSAKHEGYDKTSISGNIEWTEEYPGCHTVKRPISLFAVVVICAVLS